MAKLFKKKGFEEIKGGGKGVHGSFVGRGNGRFCNRIFATSIETLNSLIPGVFLNFNFALGNCKRWDYKNNGFLSQQNYRAPVVKGLM